MKKIFNFIALAAAAITIGVSCQKNELSEAPAVSGTKLHFVVNSGESKTFLEYDPVGKTYTPKWNKGDNLGMFFALNNDASAFDGILSNTAEDGVKAVFEGDVTAPATSGQFYSLVPSSCLFKVYSDKTIGCNIGDASNNYIQHPSRTSVDPTCDLLIAKPCNYEADSKTVVIDDLSFSRALSVLKINLAGEYIAGDVVSSIKISNDSLGLTGRIRVKPDEATLGSWAIRKPYVWAEYEEAQQPVAGTDAIYLLVKPQVIAKDTVVNIVAETNNNTINKALAFSKGDFVLEQGQVTVLNLTINESDCQKKVKAKYQLQTASGAFEVGGKYIFAFKDGVSGDYYFINNAGTSNQLEVNALSVDKDGLITTDKTEYTWTAENGAAAEQFAFRNAQDTTLYIYTSGSNTTLNTASTTAASWTPEFLSASKTYKLTCTRYISVSTKTTDVKAYATSNFVDQVAKASAVAQYAGAISVFKGEDARTALPTPTGLQVSGKVISWNAVSGAESYKVSVAGVEAYVTNPTYTYEEEDGYFDVSVYAIPYDRASYKNSDAAVLEKAKFGDPTLATPELKANGATSTSVSVKWAANSLATEGFFCEIYNGSTFVANQTVSTNSVTFTGLTGGVEYTVKVNAIAVPGTYPWKASAVASINITAVGTQVKDITAAGTYSIGNLLVYAVSGSNAILGDETGKILLYKSGHGLVVGDKLTVNGNVVAYNGVWEFSNTMEFSNKTSGNPVDHGTATESTEIPSSYTTAPTITYIHATGTQGTGSDNRTITTDGTPSYSLYLSTTSSDTEGKSVETYGYVYGYYSAKSSISYLALSLVADGISVSPSEVTLESAIGSEATVTVSASGAWTANSSEDWTVSPSSGDAGTTTVTITATKEGGDSVASLDDLVFTMTGTEKTATVTVSQNKAGATSLKIDFESAVSAYTDWTFTNATSAQTGITAHGGSKFGTTGGKTTASLVTNKAIAAPGTLKFYISKTSNNSNASTWTIKVVDSENTETTVKSVSASSMSKGTWVEVSADLSSYKNVKVKIEYSGTSAVRAIDDVSLDY